YLSNKGERTVQSPTTYPTGLGSGSRNMVKNQSDSKKFNSGDFVYFVRDDNGRAMIEFGEIRFNEGDAPGTCIVFVSDLNAPAGIRTYDIYVKTVYKSRQEAAQAAIVHNQNTIQALKRDNYALECGGEQ